MFRGLGIALLFTLIAVGVVFSLPTILVMNIQYEQAHGLLAVPAQFPVTVSPKNKTIVENAQVNALFDGQSSSFQAAVGNVENVFWNIFEWLATTIAGTSWYQGVAAVNGRIVTIAPGMRKEQVASAFGNALGWNAKQKKEFVTASASSTLPLPEGSFLPGVYILEAKTTPKEAQSLVNERFSQDILAHYGTTTAEIVPLNEALTIASLIQREAAGPDDMRIISGIIWNRIFANMDLQIDATVQYAKANGVATGNWWPRIVPSDLSRTSPYNTYAHPGLPPTPISNPTVAAVLAALNPVNTPCLFYFHDDAGQFHCTDTYAEHVALLKKYFGRGK